MPNIDDIERKAKAFSEARNELAERLQALKDEQEAAKRRRLQGLKNAVARLRAEHDELLQLLRESAGLFEKPKTRTLHGVRLGYMKQRGKLEFDDADQVVALIRKHFPEQAEVLIKSTHVPIKSALQELPAKDLKRIGATISDDSDVPFIKGSDDGLDKLIDALLGKDLAEVDGG